jgi:Glycosyl transferase family 2/Polysaccharide pyruvyl transferase
MSISFITTCMNREHDLKLTLQHNLSILDSYDDCEIIVLNYNSKGDLDEWIRTIHSSKLVYFKESTAEYFSMSHSKNMGGRLSNAKYIVNLDADNYLNRDYVDGLILEIKKDIDYPSITKESKYNGIGLDGRVGIKRSVFNYIRGYDEMMKGWGGDDFDIQNRVLAAGFSISYVRLTDERNVVISQTKEYRGENYDENNKDIEESFHRNAKIALDRYRLVNPDGFGCGSVVDINGNEITIENIPCDRFKIKRFFNEDTYADVFKPYTGGYYHYIDLPGNAGDMMIKAATFKMLEYYNIMPADDKNNPTVIFYAGGGNIGTYNFEQYQNTAIELKNKYKCDLVSLPQTWGLNGSFDGADKIYVRDEKSNEIRKDGILMPDLALSLIIPSELNMRPIYNEGAFFRVDKEATVLPNTNICDPAVWATGVMQYIVLASQYKTIRTNRLHFAIAGLLLGRDVVLYDNNYYKNKSVYDTYLKDLGCKWGVVNIK